ncbi:NAD(P)H-dependent oxidoreductase [Dyadobacter sandarakinus]|uniref:NAD(P)H-dependent oxidoreductase n=2 Tax=Dyadobacter sandarakinus TaxID=2747268 RepID=A0ABX7IDH7_9BACT|nr:NAD(P)H-dependent oxidoreductase [Dyadobacter sandarakinus]
MKITSIIILLALSHFACSSNEQAEIGLDSIPVAPFEKTLIVYLSRTSNTKAVAEMIKAQTGGKLVALELTTPYPADYRTTVEQVAQENASGFLPPLETRIDSIEKYDLIFLGFPTWGMQLPPPIKSFLDQYDLAGKTIAPFNTNAGYGIGTTFDQVKTLAPKSIVLEGFSTQGGMERDWVLFVMKGEKETAVSDQVKRWLNTMNTPW